MQGNVNQVITQMMDSNHVNGAQEELINHIMVDQVVCHVEQTLQPEDLLQFHLLIV